MKKRLFGHFGFVYSEIFSHASGMQNVSKLNHVYAKLQQFFMTLVKLAYNSVASNQLTMKLAYNSKNKHKVPE